MRKSDPLVISRTADRFAALGAEPRLQIMRILLSAHPTGMVAGQIQEELGIPASTLSHHLEKLKQVELVAMRRASTFLWYKANTEALKELLGFLYEECCTRNPVVPAEAVGGDFEVLDGRREGSPENPRGAGSASGHERER